MVESTVTKVHKTNSRHLHQLRRQEELNHRVDYLVTQILYYFRPLSKEQIYNSSLAKDPRNIVYKVLRDSGSTYNEIAKSFHKKHQSTILKSLKSFQRYRINLKDQTKRTRIKEILAILKRLNREYMLDHEKNRYGQ